MTDYRCDTGGCPQVTYSGDTVTIVETANPGQVVVTAAVKWDAYLDTVRAQERARIVEVLEAGATACYAEGFPDLAAGYECAASAISTGELERRGDDLAAGEQATS